MEPNDRSFWETAAQLAAVFGLGIVLEMRNAVPRWITASPLHRRLGSLGFLIASAATFLVFMLALGSLAKDESSTSAISLAQTALGIGAVALLANPVSDLYIASNADTLGLAYLLAPWSKAAKAKRDVRKSRRGIQDDVRLLEKLLKDIEGHLVELRKLGQDLKRSRVRVGLVIADPASSPESIAHAREIMEDIDDTERKRREHIRGRKTARREARAMLERSREALERARAFPSEVDNEVRAMAALILEANMRKHVPQLHAPQSDILPRSSSKPTPTP